MPTIITSNVQSHDCNLTPTSAVSQCSTPTAAPVSPHVTLDFAKEAARISVESRIVSAAREGKISWLRARRILASLDQAQLARLAGMTQPEVSRAEKIGQAKKMKVETIARLARALGVRVEDVL